MYLFLSFITVGIIFRALICYAVKGGGQIQMTKYVKMIFAFQGSILSDFEA